jgi:hypothetical protein
MAEASIAETRAKSLHTRRDGAGEGGRKLAARSGQDGKKRAKFKAEEVPDDQEGL